MANAPITVYDLNMNKVAYLENAYTVGYEMPLNALWTASFSLPINDPKNAECLPLRYVEIFDGGQRIDLFRIIPNVMSRDGDRITYNCEHVLATLLDDLLFQFHTVGNLGFYTTDVINYVLTKQSVTRWQRGDIQFAHQFEYTWENESLLGALVSIPKPFTAEFLWTWNTTTFPWKLNLVQPSQAVEAYIRYGANMQGIEKTIDPTSICTRIYPMGYGEGVNQLLISDVNGGLPYLDADTISTYGIVAKTFVDRRFTSAETLKAQGQAILTKLKIPRVSYTVKASELFAITKDPLDRFNTGSLVRVIDQEIGEDFIIRVVNKRRSDVLGSPGDVELEIANQGLDVTNEIADLQTRQRIGEVYAQGATNIDSHDFADNCDQTHPATLRFWIPEEAVRINKLMLSYESQPFRAYERSIASAPATTSGASSITTTGASSITTTGASSITTTGASSITTTGASSITTTGASSSTTTSSTSVIGDTLPVVSYEGSLVNPGTMSTVPDHNHGITSGTQLMVLGGGSVTFSASGSHSHNVGVHNHLFESESHFHGMNHTHDMPHYHSMPHTHEMPHYHSMPHTHDMPHTHSIPAHTHGIEYGIFEGVTPTSITVRVDGNVVPGLGVAEESVDIIPYLAKDGEGRVTRGTWHTIQITPNSLGRIVSSVVSQIFVQSRGGGDY
ncbi:phage tail spike protein [Cohnella lupini]|uniref:Phage minor structural protein n=1 Tax=Cohnella lupini TaxID=1294267 RepID=A0A3D9HZA0_9BACL|nr:phage tail spike protein [Cohnella lupini]RED54803.1 phage minor structural protein [Cohnella lupini]